MPGLLDTQSGHCVRHRAYVSRARCGSRWGPRIFAQLQTFPGEQSGKVRVAVEVIKHLAGVLADTLRPTLRNTSPGEEISETVGEHGVKQSLFVAEVLVHTFLVHAGICADAVHSGTS